MKNHLRNPMVAAFLLLSLGTVITALAPDTGPVTSAQLGEMLFGDPILSIDSTVSCASCHKPEQAFADNQVFSQGVGGIPTRRNTPSVTYMTNRVHFFWDGRAKSLEEQAMGPITHPDEMGMTLSAAIQRLRRHPVYAQAFRKVYGREPDSVSLLRSLADFERTLATYSSPYDRFLNGDDQAMSEQAIRGMVLFFEDQACANTACHNGIDMSSDSIVSLGIFSDSDKGLFELTKNPSDIGKFKTPHLRNIALTAPYMHDGSQQTLREVVVFYNNPENFQHGNVHQSARAGLRRLTEPEIDDVVEFMKSLTDQRYLKQRTESAH